MPIQGIRRRTVAVSALLAVVALPLLAACGGTAAPSSKPATPAGSASSAPSKSSAQASPTLTDVSLRLPWLSSGPDVPFYYAVAKGYYKDAGLNVTIQPGKSSLLTAETVASGSDTFGFDDATAVAGVVSKGAKIKDVAQIIDSSPTGIIHRTSVVIRKPGDLVGKTLLANSSGGPVIAMLDATLGSAHIPTSAVHLDIVAASAEASSFATHPDYLLLGFCNSTFPAAHSLVPDSACTQDSTIAPSAQALSYGIITTDQELQQHPDVVRKFVAASIKAWQFAAAHPKQVVAPSLATAQALKQLPPKADIWQVGWDQTLAGMNQPHGKPFGYNEASAWNGMLAFLHKYSGLNGIKPLSDYYTNAFLPQA